jgi:hypothetical protein
MWKVGSTAKNPLYRNSIAIVFTKNKELVSKWKDKIGAWCGLYKGTFTPLGDVVKEFDFDTNAIAALEEAGIKRDISKLDVVDIFDEPEYEERHGEVKGVVQDCLEKTYLLKERLDNAEVKNPNMEFIPTEILDKNEIDKGKAEFKGRRIDYSLRRAQEYLKLTI